MNNENQLLEEFEISELEDRVEFGLCGGSSGGGSGSGGSGSGGGGAGCYNDDHEDGCSGED